MPRREVIYGENFKPGDRIQAYLSEVVMTNRGPEIRLSRTSPKFLMKLFEIEVPEIADGTIEIQAAAREPGQRAKIAVWTADRDIDPVVACVGLKVSRVQNIVNELQGEKIDIVRWSEDLETFARAALAPADITSISRNSEERILDVIVEDDQLSLAIGRRGQNVRLAAMLSGWKINIVSKAKLQDKIRLAAENLIQLGNITDAVAQVLVQGGIMSVVDLSASEPQMISELKGLSSEESEELIKAAASALENAEINNEAEESEDIISASAVPGSDRAYIRSQDGVTENKTEQTDADKFSEAERRLREELAAFKLK